MRWSLVCVSIAATAIASTASAQSTELRIVRTTRSHGYVIVEHQRSHRGVPIVSTPIVVRTRPDGVVDLDGALPIPTRERWSAIDVDDATRAALAAVPFANARSIGARTVALMDGDTIIAAVEVDVVGEHRRERVRAWIDADLAVVQIEPRVLDASGRVYADNPVSDATTSDLPLTNLTSTTNLVGSHVSVHACDQVSSDCTPITRAAPDANGDYLYLPMPLAFDDAFAEVSAYFHGERVATYFHDTHGFDWSCMPGVPMGLLVNYSETPHVPYDGAMYLPTSGLDCGHIVFGQGTTADYAYDGDVVYHEYGHAVTDEISRLGYTSSGAVVGYEPLAINEGTSDYWAAAVQGDPVIGESIHSLEGPPTGGLRTLANTLACPNDLVGEGHFDGRIWSGFGWDLRGILGQTRADAIWFTTISSLSGGITLAQATSALMTTVASEVAMGHVTASEQAMITLAAQARGLPACTRFVPLDDGSTHTGYSGDRLVTTTMAHGVGPIEYTLAIPPDVIDVEIAIDHPTITGLATVHFMNGLPVRATPAGVLSSFDVPIGHRGTATYRVADGLTPCGTLYIGVETTDLAAGESLYTIHATVSTSHGTQSCARPQPDAAIADVGSDASADASVSTPRASCGCRTSRRSSAAPWLVLLALTGRRLRSLLRSTALGR
jgi:Zn-dependent metalloprotease